jgi:hypothetical protein
MVIVSKPVIGIVGRPDTSNDGYPLISVSESTRKAVIRCGGNPILILPPQMIDYQNTPSKEMVPMTEEEKAALARAQKAVVYTITEDGTLVTESYIKPAETQIVKQKEVN